MGGIKRKRKGIYTGNLVIKPEWIKEFVFSAIISDFPESKFTLSYRKDESNRTFVHHSIFNLVLSFQMHRLYLLLLYENDCSSVGCPKSKGNLLVILTTFHGVDHKKKKKRKNKEKLKKEVLLSNETELRSLCILQYFKFYTFLYATVNIGIVFYLNFSVRKAYLLGNFSVLSLYEMCVKNILTLHI